jgi:hypothetical protein
MTEVSVTGLLATGQIGDATTNAIFNVNSIVATGQVGKVAIWFNINTAQASSWTGVNNLQR